MLWAENSLWVHVSRMNAVCACDRVNYMLHKSACLFAKQISGWSRVRAFLQKCNSVFNVVLLFFSNNNHSIVTLMLQCYNVMLIYRITSINILYLYHSMMESFYQFSFFFNKLILYKIFYLSWFTVWNVLTQMHKHTQVMHTLWLTVLKIYLLSLQRMFVAIFSPLPRIEFKTTMEKWQTIWRKRKEQMFLCDIFSHRVFICILYHV